MLKNRVGDPLCPKDGPLYLIIFYILLILLLSLSQIIDSYAQSPGTLRGKVTNEKGEALAGALIRVKGSTRGTSSGKTGEFILDRVSPGAMLLISFVGYKAREIAGADIRPAQPISLQPDNKQLQEVEVLSTGYQNIPRERATGSFVHIDSSLLSRRVSTNILDRLDGVTSGLVFNRNLNSLANNSTMTIRGRSTIFANPEPLVVLDNFPYDGDLSGINAGDIESITVLKDAAAASIWGVRAGNGVIVVTTRKGKADSKPHVSFTASATLGGKPDLYSSPWISAPEYIGLEEFLFNKGYYNTSLNDGYSPLSPAVQVFQKRRTGEISAADSASLVGSLMQMDARDEWGRSFYRTSLNQQYQLNVSGGHLGQKYFISGSYDQNRGSQVAGSYRRLTLNANNTTRMLKDKLEIYTGFLFSSSSTKDQVDRYTPFTPYDQLRDDAGNAMEIGRFLRPSYTDTAGQGGLLDWKYRPLDELRPDRSVDLTDYRINTRLSYRLLRGLNASLYYQFQKGISNTVDAHGADSWYTRNFINTYSSRDAQTGLITSPIAPGEIRNNTSQSYRSHNGRAQMEFTREFDGYSVNAVAGLEGKDYSDDFGTQMLYGYDPSNATNANELIDATRYYTNYYSGSGDRINTSPARVLNYDRYVSYYFLSSFTSRGKYTFSLSARKDKSNIFGVKSNQKGVPLWSAGAAWEISREGFYAVSWLPYLRLRSTYGFNGNTDKSTSAYLTARSVLRNQWGEVTSEVLNPPNPSLKWEKVENLNLGVDFATCKRVLSGSAEFYMKNGRDLIGNSPIMPQTGVTSFRGNSADTRTKGLDFQAEARLLARGLKWNTSLLLSYSHDEITRYRQATGVNADIVNRNYQNPLEGYPYYSVFSYRWAGLDSAGNPLGYLNGQVSNGYSAIASSYNTRELIYHGPGTPTTFGSLRNDLSWRYLSFSINVTFKAGYYFRRTSVFAGSPYSFQQADYDLRWQKPGDELRTTVPSLVYPANSARSGFYNGSSVLVEKGDHVRLQDLRLACSLAPLRKTRDKTSWFDGQVYLYMSNLGILWKAGHHHLDPDYGYTTPPLTTSLGININFR